MEKFRRQFIKISVDEVTGDGSHPSLKEVEAFVLGDFAVTMYPCKDDSQISHIPSGCRVPQPIETEFSRRAAKKYVRNLQAANGAWPGMTPEKFIAEMPRDSPSILKNTVIAALQAWNQA